MCEAEITAWINTELSTDPFVGCNVVVAIFLLNVGSSGKALILWIPPISYNIRPDCEVDVEQIKRPQLRAKV